VRGGIEQIKFDLEYQIIGILLLYPPPKKEAPKWFSAKYFTNPICKVIWEEIEEISKTALTPDPPLILARQNLGKEASKILTEVMLDAVTSVVNPSNLKGYCEHLRDIWASNETRRRCETWIDVLNRGEEPGQTLAEVISEMENISSIRPITEDSNGMKSNAELQAMVPALVKGELRNSQYPTGYKGIDQIIGGLFAGELHIVAGRTGMGKTTLTDNIAIGCAELGHNVLAVHTEMSANQMALRRWSRRNKVDIVRLIKGELTTDEWELINNPPDSNVAGTFNTINGVSITIEAIRSELKKMKGNKAAPNLVVVDYLQGMLYPPVKNGRELSRLDQVSAIARELKQLARDHAVAVLAVAQLSRAPEARKSRQPIISDLRESGQIEMEADLVMLIHREEYYIRQERPDPASKEYAEWEFRLKQHANRANLIIAKNRNGPTTSIALKYEGEYARFTDAD
jgi:replicative DNA helicase